MVGIGSSMGAGLGGYYKGRRQRSEAAAYDEDREWTKGRRERMVDEEEFYDPMEREHAGLKLGAARREGEFGEFADEYRRRGVSREDERGELGLEDERFERPYRRRGIRRTDTRAGQEQEDFEFGRGYARDAIRRRDTREDLQMEDEAFMRPIQRRAAGRTDTMGGMDMRDRLRDQPYADTAAERADELGGIKVEDARDLREMNRGDMNAYRRAESRDEYTRNARNAVANFKVSGDPTALEDFYNNMYPDDGEITIERLDNDTYEATMADGSTATATRAELIEKSEEFFMSHPSLQEEIGGGMGYGGVGGGMGRGRRSGLGSRGRGRAGSSGKPSAYAEKVMMLAANYQQQGMSGLDAISRAHQEAGYSSRTPPGEAASDFYQDVLGELMPDAKMISYKSAEEQDAIYAAAEKRATELTDNFIRTYQQGYNGGSGINEGGRGGQGAGGEQREIPPGDIQMLRDGIDSNPGFADMFDEIYGPGAAESVLNGS